MRYYTKVLSPSTCISLCVWVRVIRGKKQWPRSLLVPPSPSTKSEPSLRRKRTEMTQPWTGSAARWPVAVYRKVCLRCCSGWVCEYVRQTERFWLVLAPPLVLLRPLFQQFGAWNSCGEWYRVKSLHIAILGLQSASSQYQSHCVKLDFYWARKPHRVNTFIQTWS